MRRGEGRKSEMDEADNMRSLKLEICAVSSPPSSPSRFRRSVEMGDKDGEILRDLNGTRQINPLSDACK